jgi:hypothetical protein
VLEQQKLLCGLQRRVEVEQDAGGADADPLGDAGDQRREDLRIGLRRMLGEPVAAIAQSFCLLGQRDGLGDLMPVVEDAQTDWRSAVVYGH